MIRCKLNKNQIQALFRKFANENFGTLINFSTVIGIFEWALKGN